MKALLAALPFKPVHSMKTCLTLSLLALVVQTGAAEPRLHLIRPDGSALPIVVAQDAAPHTRAAAVELAENLEKIGGVRPGVIEGLPDPLPAQAIWVGYQAALDRLFPGADFTLKHPEEVFLIGNENHIAITGRDRWDPKHSVVEGRRFPITDQQQEYGTANAVFTFLQDQVGVRWFYPGETGTDYPGREALNIAPFQLRYHPQFRSRIGLFNQLARGYIKDNDMQRWAKHQRLLLDSFTFDGGHYFKDWWEKYGETRPELFALQPDGTRGTFPKDPMRRKLCEGESLLWQTWLEEQEKRLAAYPHHDVLYTMANDSYYEGHCTDPRSRAWDPAPTETDVRVRMSWANGVTEEWPPLSDRYVRFANKLSELAEARFPGRDFLVMMNAYGEVGKPAPVKAEPRDNILVVSVHNFILRHEAMRKAEKQQFAEWAKVSKQLFWRPNLGNQGGTQTGFPDVPFQQAMEDMRFAAEHGVMGVFFDSLFEHWAPNAPFFHLLSQLTWNPYADGNAILEDYYRRCYGPAAGPMKEYWKLMEHTRQKMVDTIALPSVSLLRSHQFYTDEVFRQAHAHLTAAAQATEGNPKYTARVAFTRTALVHTEALVGIRALMEKAENAPKERDAIHAQVLENWTAWETMAGHFPPYSIATKRLGFDPSAPKAERGEKSTDSRRIMGFHPGSPLSKRALREMAGKGLDLE